MSQRAICRFILHRGVASGDVTATFDTNSQVIVASFETDERGGEPGDVYYKISLMEYRSFAPYLVTLASVNGKTTATTVPQRAGVPNVNVTNTPVVVNGACYFAPDGTDVITTTAANVAGTVVQINKGSAYPYQVTDQDGNNLGWVSQSSIVAAGTPWGQ